eukprot:TRINITY_DN8019_c0_g1_i1.p1 TRINITY_DN8019_c0_g1~~TRINITY_DN8019_c0_g1_i1.p1  ORF type:complete len:486 (-),score=59.11 TRINITY_DN8019_c0_g1_i1:129-1478(-)
MDLSSSSFSSSGSTQRQITFSQNEHSQFLNFIEQRMLSEEFFLGDNGHPPLNIGRSMAELTSHAMVWISSCRNSPLPVNPLAINPETDTNNNNARASTSSSDKKRKVTHEEEKKIVPAPQYALDCLPYHVLQEIRSNLPLPYSYFFRQTCKRLYFIDRAERNICEKNGDEEEPFSERECCAELAKEGYLSCLKFLRELKGFKWNVDTPKLAAQKGHLDVLTYAHENGCKWDSLTPLLAAYSGEVKCLKYAVENGCEFHENVAGVAAEQGHMEILEYINEQGLPWGNACSRAALGGKLKCLQYLHENGCKWDCMTCFVAAGMGHLTCLKYARKNGCDVDSGVLAIAFNTGKLDCLKSLIESEIRIDWSSTLFKPEYMFEPDCVKYMWDKITNEERYTFLKQAVEMGTLTVVKFLTENEDKLPKYKENDEGDRGEKYPECLEVLREHELVE